MRVRQLFATYDWRETRGLEQFNYCPRCGTSLAWTEVAHKPRPTCPACGFVCFKNPYPTVSILVVQGDRVLLGKRLGEPGRGQWALPSGYIEFEDDFVSSAIREMREETGLDVAVESILNVQSAFLPPAYHFLGIFLLAHVVGGDLVAGDDLEAVEWFPLAGPLPEMAFPPDAELIAAYAQGGVAGLPIADTVEGAPRAAVQRFPEPTVGALIFDPAGRLLLVRSHKWRGRYAVPGGHIELGEHMEEALRREVLEETGLDIHDVDFLCFQEFVYDDDYWEKRHFIFFDFTCQADSTAVVLNDENQEYIWTSPEEALKLPIEPYTRVAIEKYLGY